MRRTKYVVLSINALVDTGAMTLALPVELADQLGLEEIKELMRATFADGRTMELPIVTGLVLRIPEFNLQMPVDCVVLPPESHDTLLGQIPLEWFDLLADCKEQKLVRKHPELGRPLIRI